MKKQSLTDLTTDDLKQKEKTLATAMGIFAGVLIVLIVVLIFVVITQGITPLIAVPIALLPVLLKNRKDLSEIRAEIRSRDQ